MPGSQFRTTCLLLTINVKKLNSISTQNSPVNGTKCHISVLKNKLKNHAEIWTFAPHTGQFLTSGSQFRTTRSLTITGKIEFNFHPKYSSEWH